MTHRADQILEAARSLIAAVVETKGVHVYTHRRLSLDPEQDELPAISVDFGEDAPAAHNTQTIDSTLAVEITFLVASPIEVELREKLLELRRDVHIALMADQTLGLSFVLVTTYGGAGAPQFDVEGETLFGELTVTWVVFYRMNVADPG